MTKIRMAQIQRYGWKNKRLNKEKTPSKNYLKKKKKANNEFWVAIASLGIVIFFVLYFAGVAWIAENHPLTF